MFLGLGSYSQLPWSKILYVCYLRKRIAGIHMVLYYPTTLPVCFNH